MTTTTAAQNALSEFTKFSSVAVNALDLYGSKNSIVHYFFSNRTITDVIKRACDEADQINEVRDLVFSMTSEIYTDLIKDLEKIVETGIHSELMKKIVLRLDILQDVDSAIHTVANLATDKIDEHFTMAKKHAQHAYEASKTSPLWKKLMTPAMFEYYLNIEDETTKANIVEEACCYAREDGVVTSLAIEKAQNDTDRKKKIYVTKMDKVMINYRNKQEDGKLLKDLLETDVTGLQLDGYDAARLTDCFIEIWDVVCDGVVDKTSRNLFTEVLRHFFLLLTLEKKQMLAHKIFNKYKVHGKILPSLETFIENYQEKLTTCINALPTDHQQINSNPETFERNKFNLGWFLLVTPATALHQMMGQCITSKGLVPAVMKVCRSCPDLFKMDVVVTSTTPRDAEPLIISVLRQIIARGRNEWNSEQWDNMAYLAMSFTKSRKVKLEGADDNLPLLESYELIHLVRNEIMERQKNEGVEAFSKLLNRILANNSNNKSNANFNFSTAFHVKNLPKNIIATPELINLLYDIMIEYDSEPGETSEYCRESLKSLGARLTDANVQFEEATCKFLIEQSFNKTVWWIKYAIFTWFYSTLNRPKLQIPSGLYISLPEPVKDRFEQILTGDESSAAECYLKSLFELGFYDVDLVVHHLTFGYDHRLDDVDCLEKISLTLVDCFGKRMARKRGVVVEVPRLIKQLLDVLEPWRSFKKLEVYSASIYEAIKDSAYLSVLSRSVKVAFEKQSVISFRDTTGIAERAFDEIMEPSKVAEQLISIYCHAALRHIETEIEETTKLRAETRRLMFESSDFENQGWKMKLHLERRERKLSQQLTIILNDSCSFTRLLREIPVVLQQLLTSIVQQTLQVQDMATNRTLDEMLTEKAKKELVYVFLNTMPPTAASAEAKSTPAGVPPSPTVKCGDESVRNVASTSTSEARLTIAHVAPQPQTSSSLFAENSMFMGGAPSHRYNQHYHQSSSNREEENQRHNRGGYNNRNNSFSKPTRMFTNGTRQPPMDPHSFSASDRHEFNNRSRKPRGGHYNTSNRGAAAQNSRQFEQPTFSDNEYSQNVHDTYTSFDNYQSNYERNSPKPRNRRDSDGNSNYSSSTQAAINNLSSEKLQAAIEKARVDKLPKSQPFVGRGGGGGGNVRRMHH